MKKTTNGTTTTAGVYSHGHDFRCEPQTDLVDDGEDGVDEHQVVRPERQVVGLLQSKQHRSDQGDLGGASQTCRKRDLVMI